MGPRGVNQSHPPARCRTSIEHDRQPADRLAVHRRQLNQLVANIDNGAITLGGSARRVDVNVRGGEIRTRTPIAVTESFKADTEYGGISVEFRVAPRTTEAIADDDVTVGLPVRGPYRVRAQSEARHGETTVTVPETSDPSAPEVMAHSKGANIAVTELR